MHLAPLSREIQNAYIKLLDKVSAHILENKFDVADLIAYQIGWGKLLINWYETGVKGESPIMPGDGFTTWKYAEIAQHFYCKYRYDHPHEQIQEFDKVVQHILAIVEREYQTGNLEKVGVWPWCTLLSGKQWPLSKWIRVNTSAPYKRAVRLIKTLS